MTARTASLLVVAILAAPAALAQEAGKEAPKAAPFAPTVTVQPAERRELVDAIVVSGTVVPREDVQIAVEVEGLRIVEVLAEEGDEVKRGQVLARLDRRTFEIQLAQNDASAAKVEAAISQARTQIPQAEATLAEARPALERADQLRRSGNTTEALYEQRLSALRGAEARLSAAREGLKVAESEKASIAASRRETLLRIERSEIRSPVAGVVSRRSARVGAIATAAAAEPLFRVIENGQLELEGEVLDFQLSRVREGQRAAVAVDGGRSVEAKVRLVPAEVDRTTRLGRIRISLPKDPAFRAGGFARATVELSRRSAVAVPAGSLVFGADGVTVQVVEDGRVRVRSVKTGVSAGGYVEVATGLKEGEAVVARAGAFLRDGDAVKVAQPPERAASAGPAKGQ